MWSFRFILKLFLAILSAAMAVSVAVDSIYVQICNTASWRTYSLYLFGFVFFDKTIDLVDDIIERWGL